MESKLKCSLNDHSKIDAIKYCLKCEVYMCNKCLEVHKNFLPKHQIFDISKGKNSIFLDLCEEEKHNHILEYFCKTHNKLCCALCITKIRDKGKGQHKDCNVCIIEDIKSQKQNQLKQNISKLEELSDNLQKKINEIKTILDKINANKEELKLKIKNIFTSLRSALNDREEELLSQVEKNYDLYVKSGITKETKEKEGTKESEQLLDKINKYLEKGKLAEKEWNNTNKLSLCINESIIIENNMKEINIKNEKIKRINSKERIEYKFIPDEFEILKILLKIKNFGEIKELTENNKNEESKIKENYEKVFPKFIEEFKNQLKIEKKIGDKNEIDIEIRGSKNEPKGASIDLFTIDQKLFKEYFSQCQEHLKTALFAYTFNFELKDEKDFNSLKAEFEILKEKIINLSFYKKNPDCYDIILRNNGKKITIDFISRQGEILQLLLELCINLSEYIKFYFKIKTEIDFYSLFNCSSDDKSNIFNVFANTKLSGKNLKYLLNSIINAVKLLKLKKEEAKTKLINLINLIIYFIGINLKVEYDIDFIKYEANKTNKYLTNINFARSLLNLLKVYFEAFGLKNLVTSLNLDCLSFAFGIPKYENGLAIKFRLTGISRYFEELFEF